MTTKYSAQANTAQKHILLVDDHAVVRQGYAALIALTFPEHKVIEAENAKEAIALAKTHPIDMAVLDINLDGTSGISLAQQLGYISKAISILFFSMYDEVNVVEKAMQTGALGYISKRSKPEMMQSALKTVLAGKHFIPAEIATKIAQSQLHQNDQAFTQLTAKEFDVLLAFANADDKATIAHKMQISEKTVANSLTQIKIKLGLNSTNEIFHYALRHGFIDAAASRDD